MEEVDRTTSYLMSVALWVRRLFDLEAGRSKEHRRLATEIVKKTRLGDMLLSFREPSAPAKNTTKEEDKATQVALAKARWAGMIYRNSKGRMRIRKGKVEKVPESERPEVK